MEMALKEEELAIIGEYVQNHLKEWLPEQTPTPASNILSLELGERVVRVEETLKNQMALMKQGFDMMDKRFEQVDKRFEQVDKRIEQIDKRFDIMQNSIDRRFDEVNLRLENIQARMFHFMIWSSGFTATIAGIVIAVIKFT